MRILTTKLTVIEHNKPNLEQFVDILRPQGLRGLDRRMHSRNDSMPGRDRIPRWLWLGLLRGVGLRVLGFYLKHVWKNKIKVKALKENYCGICVNIRSKLRTLMFGWSKAFT